MTTSDTPRCPQCCMTRDERNAYKDGCPMNVPSIGCPFYDARTSDDKTSPAEGVRPMTKLLSIPEGAIDECERKAAYLLAIADKIQVNEAFAALRASAIQQGEAPVAWRIRLKGDGDDAWWIGAKLPDDTSAFDVHPLYAAPQPVQASPAKDERAEFERWYSNEYHWTDWSESPDGPFDWNCVGEDNSAWEAWQARAALTTQSDIPKSDGSRNLSVTAADDLEHSLARPRSGVADTVASSAQQGPEGHVLASEMTVQQLQERIGYLQAALQTKVCGDPSKAVSWPTQADKGESK